MISREKALGNGGRVKGVGSQKREKRMRRWVGAWGDSGGHSREKGLEGGVGNRQGETQIS